MIKLFTIALSSGTVTLKVDGKAVQTITLPHTLPMILQWDESFDIGSDTLTGVNDADYRPPSPLTAKLNKLTIKVDRPKLSPEDMKKFKFMTEMMAEIWCELGAKSVFTPTASFPELRPTDLAGFKKPKSVEFWKELPKSPQGKILKKEIRKHYGS